MFQMSGLGGWRRQSDQLLCRVSEVWSGLVAAAARSDGGRFRPSLCRLLTGRLARLWAGPAAELAGPLQAVSRFLVVPARRLMQPVETGTPAAWVSQDALPAAHFYS